MSFKPDYRNIVDAAYNRRPARLPLYEHLINIDFIEKVLDRPLAELISGSDADVLEYFKHYCGFFKDMTYDTVSFEFCIGPILPDSGALLGERAGPIQNRSDFENYPWDKLPELFWQTADRQYKALAETLPEGMKLIGGVGNGAFEISEDLVGFEYLSYMQIDDPQLFADLYTKIGDLMVQIWSEFLKRYGHLYGVCRFGDDLGFKTGTLMAPSTIVSHIVPQYKRVIDLVHNAGLPFLLHSCGCIFDVMDQIIDAGIDAKHSNEDVIAPFDRWIEDYNDRIGLFGGIDVDLLCSQTPDKTCEYVAQVGQKFRKECKGYALGSGNSIPGYVPVDGYMAMIEAAHRIREDEAG